MYKNLLRTVKDTQIFSITESTDQSFLKNNRYLGWESYETHRYNTKNSQLLKQLGYIITIVL